MTVKGDDTKSHTYTKKEHITQMKEVIYDKLLKLEEYSVNKTLNKVFRTVKWTSSKESK